LPTITQDHIDGNTPLGANLVAGGATFRVWAPAASEVHLKLNTPRWWRRQETALTAENAPLPNGANGRDAHGRFTQGEGQTMRSPERSTVRKQR
jgi:hypothetical protein